MQTEILAGHAVQFVKERPTLHGQLEDPLDVIDRLMGELQELRVEVVLGIRQRILDELTDTDNYFATLQYVMYSAYFFTDEEIIDHSHFKYKIRNHLKYPPEGYQNGTPAHVQQKRDVNRWAQASTYDGATPEQILGNEWY
jgi:hypothetical protein